MLVLSRKPGEKLLIGDDVVITVVRIGPNTVRLGIDAPSHLNIVREELGEPKLPKPPEITASSRLIGKHVKVNGGVYGGVYGQVKEHKNEVATIHVTTASGVSVGDVEVHEGWVEVIC